MNEFLSVLVAWLCWCVRVMWGSGVGGWLGRGVWGGGWWCGKVVWRGGVEEWYGGVVGGGVEEWCGEVVGGGGVEEWCGGMVWKRLCEECWCMIDCSLDEIEASCQVVQWVQCAQERWWRMRGRL